MNERASEANEVEVVVASRQLECHFRETANFRGVEGNNRHGDPSYTTPHH